MASEVTFTLTDSDGVEHNYIAGTLPVRKALPFAKHLLAGALKPLARLVGRVDNAEAEAYASSVPEGQSLMDSLEGVDLAALADDLGDVILELPDDKLLMLFESVVRDGTPLNTDAALDVAYRHNWGEFAQAVWHLVKANGFLSFIGSRLQAS